MCRLALKKLWICVPVQSCPQPLHQCLNPWPKKNPLCSSCWLIINSGSCLGAVSIRGQKGKKGGGRQSSIVLDNLHTCLLKLTLFHWVNPYGIHVESMEWMLAGTAANSLYHGHHGFHVEWSWNGPFLMESITIRGLVYAPHVLISTEWQEDFSDRCWSELDQGQTFWSVSGLLISAEQCWSDFQTVECLVQNYQCQDCWSVLSSSDQAFKPMRALYKILTCADNLVIRIPYDVCIWTGKIKVHYIELYKSI